MSLENVQKPELEAQTAHSIAQVETAEVELSQAHHDYLLERHKTVTLDPLPTGDPADPLNWPSWKVCLSVPHWRSPC